MSRIRVPSGTVQKLEKVFDDLQENITSNQLKRLNVLFNESFGVFFPLINGVPSSDDLKVTDQSTVTQKTKFSVVRYGNVAGSRGSVIPFFLSKKNDPFSGSQVRQFFKEMFAKNIKFELSLKSKLKQLNKKIIEYDKHQLEILEVSEKQDRLIIEGRCGTGKSMLAEETAKRFAKKFEKVLFICGANKPFGWQMGKIMNEKQNVDVFHFSGLCKDLYDKANFTKDEVDEDVANTKKYPKDAILKPYEVHQLMLEKAIEKTGIKYDALVVDEGQDINKSQWDSLLMILKRSVYTGGDAIRQGGLTR